MREFERVVLLNAIDRHWMDHIDAMDDLRNGIGLRAYGQRNPVQEYKMESYDMFNDMVFLIREDALRRLYQSRVERLPERRKAVDTDKLQEGFAGKNRVAEGAKAHQQGGAPTDKNQPGAVGRNQPCPCGSGQEIQALLLRQKARSASLAPGDKGPICGVSYGMAWGSASCAGVVQRVRSNANSAPESPPACFLATCRNPF